MSEFEPGTRLGRFEILAAIGAGGPPPLAYAACLASYGASAEAVTRTRC